MRVSPIRSYSCNPRKQINFGIIKDKKAEEIIEANSKNQCVLGVLSSSKLFTFWSEGQKLKVKLNEDFANERIGQPYVDAIKTDKTLNYDDPAKTVDAFRSLAWYFLKYQNNDMPSHKEYVEAKRALVEAVRKYSETPEGQTFFAQIEREKRRQEEERLWNWAMNDLAD